MNRKLHLKIVHLLIIFVIFFSVGKFNESESAVSEFETRCGWFYNPTPANAWLIDRDGEWTIAVQGGYQAEGDWPPDFKPKQWVKTNGEHGYGCACFRVKVNRKTHDVIEIKSAYARPLSACRKDRSLKDPKT